MTPAQREERRQRELAAIFELGQRAAVEFPPLTDEQIAQCAFIINPRLVAPRDHPSTALPQAA